MTSTNGSGGAVATTTRDTLSMPTIASSMDGGRFNLLRQTFAKGVTDTAAIYAALEVAAKYDLDPLAKGEIWCTQDRRGDVLLMVGRDGLRKIAQRNGLDMDCDVVRERDTFRVTRNADRTRTIEQAYEEARREDAANAEGDETPEASSRGRIVGAWAEVWDPESGVQRGYYYAPIAEYIPRSERKREFSPWGSQTSVMILAAAERQALRQATPLSGLLTEGEMTLNDERMGPEPVQLGDVEAIDAEILDALDAIVASGLWTESDRDGQLVAHGAQTTDSVDDALRSMPKTARVALFGLVCDLTAAHEAEVQADREEEATALDEPDYAEGEGAQS